MKNSAMSALSPSSKVALKPALWLTCLACLTLSACNLRSIPGSDQASGFHNPLGLGAGEYTADENGMVTKGDVQYIIARAGDSFGDLASRAGVGLTALASYNGLPESYTPKAGESFAVPQVTRVETPVGFGEPLQSTIESDTLSPDALSTPSTHTVIAGETIFEVARLYSIPVTDLARANNLNGDLSIVPGQTLVIPKQTASLDTMNDANPSSLNDASTDTPEENTSSDLSSEGTQTASTGGAFSAPVSGSISQGFNPADDHDGYVYSTASQAPVQSVGAGKVVLVSESTGDQGTVVMVQHPNGLISIYGRMSNLKVAKGDQVSKGQTLGTTESGELMFQLRRGTSPVDPGNYL